MALSLPHADRVQSLLGARFGIDSRALGVFRIGLGTLLCLDLLLRARHLGRFYTDSGVLPVALLAEQHPLYARVSLHALSGALWWQAVLVAVAFGFAVALAAGYRTRIATVGSLVLLASLHARNPFVLTGGDALLQHLLVWSLFLPLGERWSVDAIGQPGHRASVRSIASAGLLLQVVLVYGVNAVLKLRGDHWPSGTAVADILSLDQYSTLFGPLLVELPIAPELATWAWLGLLLCSPALVLATSRTRTALVGAFAAAHLGMALTMALGIFPFVSVLALVPFLPVAVWDGLENLFADQSQDGRLLPVETSGGRDRRVPSSLTQSLAGILLAGLLVFNAMAVGLVPVPAPADDLRSGTTVESRWTMFAPEPPGQDRWYVAPGRSGSNQSVDAFDGGAVHWKPPDDVAASYPSARMRKYMRNLRYDDGLQRGFASFLCSRWERTREESLRSVTLYVVESASQAEGPDPRQRTALARRECD